MLPQQAINSLIPNDRREGYLLRSIDESNAADTAAEIAVGVSDTDGTIKA